MTKRFQKLRFLLKFQESQSGLFRVTLAFVLGGMLTLLTWLIQRFYICVDVQACAWGYEFSGRGFPLPWNIEYPVGILASTVTLLTGIVVVNGLLDLLAWSGLVRSILLLLPEVRVKEARRLDSKFVASILGFTCAVAGFSLAFLAPRILTETTIQGEYGPYTVLQFITSFPLVWYLTILVGEATAVSWYRNSRSAPWLLAISVGILMTIMTLFQSQSVSISTRHSDDVMYGFPFGWLVIRRIYMPGLFASGVLGVIGQSFLFDVLVWGSITGLLLRLVLLRVGGTTRTAVR